MSKQLDELFLHLLNSDTDSFVNHLSLLDKDELNTQSAQGLTLLHVAASKGLKAAVIALLEKKADPNQLTVEGVSPLQCAVESDSGAIVKQLIAYGVSDLVLQQAKQFAEQSDRGEMLALLNISREEIMEQLVKQQAEATFSKLADELAQHEEQGDELPSPKEGLAMFEHFDNMNYDIFMRDLALYVEKHGDINIREPKKERTLLMMAAKDALKRQVQALLEAGADPHLEDRYKMSTLYYAGKGQSPGCLTLIANKAMETGVKLTHAQQAIGFFTMDDDSPAVVALRRQVEDAKKQTPKESPKPATATQSTQAKTTSGSSISPAKLVGGLVAVAGTVYAGSLLLPEVCPWLFAETHQDKQERRQQIGFFANATSRALTGMDICPVEENTCPAALL